MKTKEMRLIQSDGLIFKTQLNSLAVSCDTRSSRRVQFDKKRVGWSPIYNEENAPFFTKSA